MTAEQTQIIAAIRAHQKKNKWNTTDLAVRCDKSGSRMRGILVSKPRPASLETLLDITNKLGIRFELVQTS